MAPLEGPMQVVGSVKWFDPSRGFGFVLCEGIDQDVLLHVNVLKKYGQSSVAPGTALTIIVQNYDRGLQAIEVVNITVDNDTSVPRLDDFAKLSPEDIAVIELEPARVKWFYASKGFGFANVFGFADDVFLHAEVLRYNGLADVSPGEAIAVKVVQAQRGLMACEIKPWDSV